MFEVGAYVRGGRREHRTDGPAALGCMQQLRHSVLAGGLWQRSNWSEGVRVLHSLSSLHCAVLFVIMCCALLSCPAVLSCAAVLH
jgi:hypothetical protein